MSGFSTPSAAAGAAEPKVMSSRLANMKFMQRASLSKSSDSSKYPTSEPQSKRRKFDDSNSRNSTPRRSGDSTPLSQFAARVMEERAGLATATPGKEGEDTEWVLDVHVPQPNGQNESDSSEDDIWSTKATGRQTFGGFKRNKNATARSTKNDADADLSSVSEGELSESPPPRQNKGGPAHFLSKPAQRQASDSGSPLRAHAQQEARKRKNPRSQPSGRKKARKTM